MTIEFKLTASAILLLLTILSGIWLSNLGRPLNGWIFNIHKLIGLAGVIFMGMAIHNLCKTVENSGIIISLIIISGLFFLALFITGAFLSFEKPPPGIVKVIHTVFPVPAIISAIVLIYLLIKTK